MPSPIIEVREGAGAWQSTANGVNVTPGAALSFRLIDSNAKYWTLECVGTDELSSVLDVNADLEIDGLTKTASANATVEAGRAFLFRSTVGVQQIGRDADNVLRSDYVYEFSLYTLVDGKRVGALGETNWLAIFNAAIRLGGVATVDIIPLFAGEREALSVFTRWGGAYVDLSRYPETSGGRTRRIRLEASVQKTSGATSAEIQLVDVDHSSNVAGTNLVHSASNALTRVISSALPVSSESGDLRSDVPTQCVLYGKMNGGNETVDRVWGVSASLIVEYV